MEDTAKKETSHKGLPFDNLFLNSGYVSGFNDWWMYMITICITILCYAIAPVLTAIPIVIKAQQQGVDLEKLTRDPNKLFDYEFMQVDKNLVLIALLGIFVITATGFLLCITKLHKKTITSILSGYEKFRFRRFWFAFTVWGLLLVITVLVSYLLNPEEFKIDFNVQGFLISTILMFVFMPVQTGFEEVFFRGYLVQGLSQIFKNGFVPVLITSLIFGAAHMSNPEVKEYGWAVMLAYYVFFALFMGCLSLLDEGIELAFGIHFANNFISSILISVPGSVLRTYSVFEAKSDDPRSEIVLWFCMAFVTFLVFWRRYRWKNFKLIIK
jgi:membrane protease YdiL (CAAX protease family)